MYIVCNNHSCAKTNQRRFTWRVVDVKMWISKYIHKLCVCVMFLHALISVKWRHQMETFSALWEESTGRFPSQRPMTRSFEVFLDLCLNKRLSKHVTVLVNCVFYSSKRRQPRLVFLWWYNPMKAIRSIKILFWKSAARKLKSNG